MKKFIKTIAAIAMVVLLVGVSPLMATYASNEDHSLFSKSGAATASENTLEPGAAFDQEMINESEKEHSANDTANDEADTGSEENPATDDGEDAAEEIPEIEDGDISPDMDADIEEDDLEDAESEDLLSEVTAEHIKEILSQADDYEEIVITLPEDINFGGETIELSANHTTIRFEAEQYHTITNEATVFLNIIGNDNTISFSNVALYEARLLVQGDGNDIASAKIAGNTSSAIYVSGQNTVIRESALSDNTAESGAGIYLQHGSLSITDSAIQDNTANGGGGIYVDGGALYLGGGVSIANNTAQQTPEYHANGGGISINNGGQVTIAGATLANNNAQMDNWERQCYGNGGAIYVGSGSSLDIQSATIQDNHADIGGGIHYAANAGLDVHLPASLVVTGNTARRLGGGVFIGANNTATIAGSTITGNTAKQGSNRGNTGEGGGVYVAANSSLHVSQANISDNLVYTAGGGIYGAESTAITINSGTINNNTSYGSGAGIETAYATSYNNDTSYVSEKSTITINGGQIDGNKAIQEPGSSRSYNLGAGLSGYEIIINGGSVSNNQLGYGFAAAGYAYSLEMNGGKVSGNTSQTAAGVGYYVAEGGFFTSNFTMTDGEISGNTFVEKSSHQSPLYVYGGGVFVNASDDSHATSHINISGGSISDNTADMGGGISHVNYYSSNYISPRQSVNITGGVFSGNAAHMSGGAAWLNRGDVVLGGNARFEGNHSGGEGGAIEKIGGLLSVKDSVIFDQNTAEKDGGAIDLWNTVKSGFVSLQLEGQAQFNKNTGRNGGAIALGNYVADSDTTTAIQDAVSFVGNHASKDGGAIYTIAAIAKEDDSTAYVYNIKDIAATSDAVVFADNKAASGWIMSDEADIAQHKQLIQAEKYTHPFAYAYSNYDIVYKKGEQYVPPVLVDVTYQYNFGDMGVYLELQAEENSLLTEPTAPTIDGYKFTGWYKDAETTTLWAFDTDQVLESTTLYAGWSKATTPKPSPEPTEPVEPSPEPTEPVEPTPEPTEPVEPTPEPSEPVEPSPVPTQPAKPTPEPSKPGEPSPEPSEPVAPIQPTNPGRPNPPTGPAAPVKPSVPPPTPSAPMEEYDGGKVNIPRTPAAKKQEQPAVVVPQAEAAPDAVQHVATMDASTEENSPALRFGDAQVPLFGQSGEEWALLNLLLTIAGGIVAIVWIIGLLVRKNKKQDKEYTTSEQRSSKWSQNKLWRVLGIVTAAVSIVVFMLTENLRLPMALADVWTIVMVILLGVQLLFGGLLGQSKNKEPEDSYHN